MNKLQIIAKFLLFLDLLLSFNDLPLQGLDFISKFLYLNVLLTEFVLTVFDYFFCFDFTGSGVFSVDEDLSVEVKSVFSYFLDWHIRLIKNSLWKCKQPRQLKHYPQGLQNRIWLEFTLINIFLEGVTFACSYIVFFLIGEKVLFKAFLALRLLFASSVHIIISSSLIISFDVRFK